VFRCGDLEGVVDEQLQQMGHSRRVAALTSRFSVIRSWLSRSALIATAAQKTACRIPSSPR
jgi:hypothetical protein